MPTKEYRVVKQLYDQQSLLSRYPQYTGYRVYLVESYVGTGSYNRENHHIVTREFLPDRTQIWIDADREFLPLSGQPGSSFVTGNIKTYLYRPAKYLSDTFRIKSLVPPDERPVEVFKNYSFPRSEFYLYEAERKGSNGYADELCRIFTRCRHLRGMGIPANETDTIPARSSLEPPYYAHDTESKAYSDRVWSELKKIIG